MAQTTALSPMLIKELVRPLAKLCIRHSLAFRDFCDIFRVVMVEETERTLRAEGRKVNDSRISVATGIRREQVKRVLAAPDEEIEVERGVAPRVVSHWRHDEEFTTKGGEPRVISAEEFADLVRSVSEHVSIRTIKEELLRLGAIEKSPRGLRLLKQVFSTEGSVDAGFEMLGKDVNSLYQAVEENLLNRKSVSNLHIRTEFDNIIESALPDIRRWLIEEGKTFHRKAREYFSRFDKDIAKGLKDDEAGRRVTLTAFSFTDYPED